MSFHDECRIAQATGEHHQPLADFVRHLDFCVEHV
jgi:hypothetical protein